MDTTSNLEARKALECRIAQAYSALSKKQLFEVILTEGIPNPKHLSDRELVKLARNSISQKNMSKGTRLYIDQIEAELAIEDMLTVSK